MKKKNYLMNEPNIQEKVIYCKRQAEERKSDLIQFIFTPVCCASTLKCHCSKCIILVNIFFKFLIYKQIKTSNFQKSPGDFKGNVWMKIAS